MNLDQATVTIPYKEFQKHQDDLKELIESNAILDKRNILFSELIIIHREYMNYLMKTRGTSTDVENIHTFAERRGFRVDTDVNKNYMFVKK